MTQGKRTEVRDRAEAITCCERRDAAMKVEPKLLRYSLWVNWQTIESATFLEENLVDTFVLTSECPPRHLDVAVIRLKAIGWRRRVG